MMKLALMFAVLVTMTPGGAVQPPKPTLDSLAWITGSWWISRSPIPEVSAFNSERKTASITPTE